MIKRIGYACINLNLKPQTFKTCRLNSVYKYGLDYLRDKIINNLVLIKDILNWNIQNQIFMYRVSSDLLPLVTHPDILKDFKWRWKEDQKILTHIGEINHIVTKNNIRLSMHPDQFTVLNSLKENVVNNSIDYLQHHYELLTALGGSDIIIHVGGVYQDKNDSINRFIKNFDSLDKNLKDMIRIENDDTSYNIDEVLSISVKAGIPIVLDIHHHMCNHKRKIYHQDIIEIKNSWKNTNLIPKMHISSGKTSTTDRKHHDYIKYEDFQNLMDLINNIEIDLMVEAKAKDMAVLKIINEFMC